MVILFLFSLLILTLSYIIFLKWSFDKNVNNMVSLKLSNKNNKQKELLILFQKISDCKDLINFNLGQLKEETIKKLFSNYKHSIKINDYEIFRAQHIKRIEQENIGLNKRLRKLEEKFEKLK